MLSDFEQIQVFF